MKTFNQLVDEVTFESGATGLQALETVAGIIIEDVLNKHTSQTRYPELYVPNTLLVVADLATGKYTLPTDYQHINWETFHIRFGGDVDHQIQLLPLGNKILGDNTNPSRYYTRTTTQIRLWPYGALVSGDQLYLDYYRISNAKTNNLIVPDSLCDVVKLEAIGRMMLTLGNKAASNYITLGRESHSQAIAAVDLPSQN